MAHDKNTITISRFSGFDTAEGSVPASVTWHAAVTPEHRKWILYEDTSGVPYLYIRAADTQTAAGDAVEHYVYAGDASGLTRPINGDAGGVRTLAPIRVYPIVRDDNSHAWMAATSGGHATASDARGALRALLDVPEAMDALFADTSEIDSPPHDGGLVLAL